MKKRILALVMVLVMMAGGNALAAREKEGLWATINGKKMNFEVLESKNNGSRVTVCFDIYDRKHEEASHRFVMMMDRYVEPETYEIDGDDGRMTLWYYTKPRYGSFSEKYEARYAVKPSPLVNLGKAMSTPVGSYEVHFDSVDPFCCGTVNAVLEEKDGSCVEVSGEFGFWWP